MKIFKVSFRNSISYSAFILLLSIFTFQPTFAVEKPYQRLISLSPSATENLFAIGAGKQVIAVDDNSNFPINVPRSKLSSFNPSAEAISKFKPDLVIIQKTATKSAQVSKQLRLLKIRTYIEKTPIDIEDVYSEIRDLGKLTGKISEAEKIVANVKQARSAALKLVKSSSLTFYHELDSSLYSATSNTFIGKVYADFGLRNIADAAAKADDGGYPQLQSEYVISANPDIIFLSDSQYGESAAKVGARTGWSTIKAIKTGKVIELPADIPSRWGPRIADFYRLIADAIS